MHVCCVCNHLLGKLFHIIFTSISLRSNEKSTIGNLFEFNPIRTSFSFEYFGILFHFKLHQFSNDVNRRICYYLGIETEPRTNFTPYNSRSHRYAIQMHGKKYVCDKSSHAQLYGRLAKFLCRLLSDSVEIIQWCYTHLTKSKSFNSKFKQNSKLKKSKQNFLHSFHIKHGKENVPRILVVKLIRNWEKKIVQKKGKKCVCE